MLTLLYWGMPCFLILMGLFIFVFNRKHLLSMLLSLEYIVLSLFLFIIYLFKFNSLYETF